MNITRLLLIAGLVVATILGIKQLTKDKSDNYDEGTWFDVNSN